MNLKEEKHAKVSRHSEKAEDMILSICLVSDKNLMLAQLVRLLEQSPVSS